MRKWLIFVLLIGLMIFPSAAAEAEGGAKLDALHIELWSEYDQPSMLVISQFVVSKETTLPVEVTLRFPKGGNLVAVAVETNGELLNKKFTGPEEQGNWQQIKITVDSRDPHRIEYYQPLTRDGNKRQFKYQWFGDYYVKEFAITMLVPADSTELITSPVLENTTTSTDGSSISGTVIKNDLRMGNSFQFELAYQRASDTPILTDPSQADQVTTSAPVDEDTPGRVSIANLPWIIGGFGVALILIALFSYWRSTQSSDDKPPRRRRRQTEETGDQQAYCHECGARAHPGDRFCRTCGSRIKVE
ncbi:MAG: hypothetical protein ACXW4Q_13630 [Anaerolineales bacterium]